jgi:hypothetical protein
MDNVPICGTGLYLPITPDWVPADLLKSLFPQFDIETGFAFSPVIERVTSRTCDVPDPATREDVFNPGILLVNVDIKFIGSGSHDPSFVTSKWTNSQGQYEFDSLSPGVYTVCEVSPTGWIQTAPVNSQHGVVSCAGLGTNLAPLGYSVVLNSGSIGVEGIDFGSRRDLAVTAPNGGETWGIGTSHDITWTSSGISGNVKVEVSRNGGASWSPIVASTADNGQYAWVVTGPTTTQGRIRVSRVSEPTAAATSNANVTLGGGSITVTAPNGGETWAIGTPQNITWTSKGIGANVKVEVSRNGGHPGP